MPLTRRCLSLRLFQWFLRPVAQFQPLVRVAEQISNASATVSQINFRSSATVISATILSAVCFVILIPRVGVQLRVYRLAQYTSLR